MAGYGTLVIHPDMESRVRFKAAAVDLRCFGSISFASTLQAGNEKIAQASAQSEGLELIYLSSRYDQAVAGEFIRSNKQKKLSESAFLLMVSGEEIKTQSLASYLVDGIDGVLPEPFSSESLRKSVERATTIVRGRKEAKLKVAMGLLAKDAVVSVDKLADAVRRSGSSADPLKTLRGIQKIVTSVSGEMRDHYFEQLFEELKQALPFVDNCEREALARHETSSRRVRQIIIRKSR